MANKQDSTSYDMNYMALHAERIGKSKRANRLYETALDLETTARINKDLILLKVEGISVATDDNESDVDE